MDESQKHAIEGIADMLDMIQRAEHCTLREAAALMAAEMERKDFPEWAVGIARRLSKITDEEIRAALSEAARRMTERN